MKGNYQTMEEFATRIEQIERTKQDFIVPHNAMRMHEDGETLEIMGGTKMSFPLTPIAHQQVAEKLGIPKRYYDMMAEIPELRAQNVNSWLKHTDGDQKMVRTLDNKGRAFLSDKFVPFDNFVVMESALPIIRNFVDLKVAALSLTETKMYAQIVIPSIRAEVRPGDIVQAGIVLSNSEVGYGAIDVSRIIWRLQCLNGLVGQSLLNRYHIGKKVTNIDGEMNIFKHDTLLAEVETFKLQLRDVLEHSLTQAFFDAEVNKLREAAEDKITNPVRVVENVTKRFGFSDKEGEGIVTGLIAEGDATRWGLVNSITALAKSIDNRDRQYQVEQIGYEIVTLPPTDWEVIKEGNVA
jgi:hypothetical protein